MPDRKDALRACPTAYECRDHLPELNAWMADDDLKQVRLWKGSRFERGQMYFDLDNPARGPFVATGDEAPPTDRTYTCRNDIPEQVWAKLATWQQPISESQAQAIDGLIQKVGIGPEQGAGRA